MNVSFYSDSEFLPNDGSGFAMAATADDSFDLRSDDENEDQDDENDQENEEPVPPLSSPECTSKQPPPVHQYIQQQQINDIIFSESRQYERPNTRRAYDGKGEEFREFCAHVHADEDVMQREIVTEAKMMDFLFYCSRRNVRTVKAKDHLPFDIEEYNRIKANPEEQPDNPIGISTIDQYYSAMIKIHEEQALLGYTQLKKTDIQTDQVKKLLENMKKCKRKHDRKKFSEKMGKEITPLCLCQQSS